MPKGCQKIMKAVMFMLENCKIVADSSADLLTGALEHVPFVSVPMVVTAEGVDWVDDASADPVKLVEFLHSNKGKSSSACPGTGKWEEAFGDAQHVFCVTITSGLSGSYNAARVAAQEYEAEHPGRRVHVIDSLSAGPVLTLLVQKLEELCMEHDDFDAVVQAITAYQQHTYLTFTLKTLHNFVCNGRVSPAIGAMTGLLGIRIVGVASETGHLQVTGKCRNERKTIAEILDIMKKRGYEGGKALIHHCCNEEMAQKLREAIKAAWADAKITIDKTRLLCSYYADDGGLLLGFETA